MLFNSLEFIYIFLPITLGLFYLASHFRLLKLCKYLLLIASLVFYAYWKTSYFYIIIFSIVTNYTVSVVIEKYRKKRVLWAGILFNLGLLGYFKYMHFFVENLSRVVELQMTTVELLIPLGISFYTFQQITYLVDLYQKKTKPIALGEYALFVSFFPQLIAGPIVHYREMMPQFKHARTYLVQYQNIFKGAFFFLVGLFSKVVIADSMNPIVEMGFTNAPLLSFVEAWGALTAYSMQIYFDFAGYSNMAIGLGLLFNIRIPVNFNSPYQASSIIEFWKRWHMTLTRFLTDYLYMPLVMRDWLPLPLRGNTKAQVRAYTNIFITMLIAGFWHGAGWTFIFWGGYHGALMIANGWFRRKALPIPKLLGIALTFFVVTYGWVFFRSTSFDQAMAMTRSLMGANGFQLTDSYFLWKHQFVMILASLAMALWIPNAQWWGRKIKPSLAWALFFAGIFVTNLLFMNRESVFLYFQF